MEELLGDRDTNDYASLKGRQWDVCIDNPTTVPHWVRDAAAVLKGNVKQYIFISTISVYSDSSKPDSDESAPRENTQVLTPWPKHPRHYAPICAYMALKSVQRRRSASPI
ncbi:MAG: hypothetical protein HC782_00240 [Gammaproteobacteria bacterium]|nr:hypothetical protein [Gammaproteobacteria bacterium]